MPARQDNMSLINGTNDMKTFIKLYNEAKSKYKAWFSFKGSEIPVAYAYYTIEYLVLSKQVKGKFNQDKIFIHEEE